MATSQPISTSPRGGRPLVEATPCLRVSDLRSRWGWLRRLDVDALDGSTVKLALDHIPDDATFAWLHVEHWPAGSAWASRRYHVELFSRPAHLGGRRWFLRCPETGAGGGALYLSPDGSRLASREALGLAHRSQRQRAPARAAARAAKVRDELGGGAEPRRPAGMHAATFVRHAALLARLDAVAVR